MELAAEAPKSPEEIFPLEVWGLILDNLDNASDLKSCYQTCNAWAELLKQKRTTFLMPEVLPILYKYVGDYPDRQKHYLSPEELLPLRLVSRSWKETLDSIYQHHPSINLIGCLERVFPNWEPFPLNQYKFNEEYNGEASLERFLAKDFPLDSNPFMARFIKYDDSIRKPDVKDPPQREFANSFTKLLKSFGTHIWNCTLHFKWVSVNRTGLHTVLRRYLSLMPNLKSLTVTVNDHQCFNKFEHKIENLLKTQPFPELKQLVELEMNSVPIPFSMGLLAASKNVRTLSICSMYVGLISDDMVNVHSTNMEHLLLRGCSSGDLGRLRYVTWPLKKLELGISHYMCDGMLSDIFQVVSTFSNTLEYLLIRFREKCKENNKELQMLRLELPNLKEFRLKIPFQLKTIDFLEGCTSLQAIHLYISASKEKDDAKSLGFGDEKADFAGNEKVCDETHSSRNGKFFDIACSSGNEEVGDDTADSSGVVKNGDSDDSSGDCEEVKYLYIPDFSTNKKVSDMGDSSGDCEEVGSSDDSSGDCEEVGSSDDSSGDCEEVGSSVDSSGDGEEVKYLYIPDFSSIEKVGDAAHFSGEDEERHSDDSSGGYEKNLDDAIEDREEVGYVPNLPAHKIFGDIVYPSEDDEDGDSEDSFGDSENEEMTDDASGDCEEEEVDRVPNISAYEKVGDIADSSGNDEDANSDDSFGNCEKDGNSDDSSEDFEEVGYVPNFPAFKKVGDIVDTFGDEDASASVIQFYDCITSMQKSNVWEVLPNLAFIVIKTTSTTQTNDSPGLQWFTWSQHDDYIQKLKAAEMENSPYSNEILTS